MYENAPLIMEIMLFYKQEGLQHLNRIYSMLYSVGRVVKGLYKWVLPSGENAK
jgi:hypothetical protein